MNGITYPPQALADPLVAAKAFVEQFTEQFTEEPVEQSIDPANAAGDRENGSPRIDWQWGDGVSPLADRLPSTTAIAIYRLTTEFVRNALRHANATRIEVSAAFVDGVAVVKIHDDGCGFDPRQVDSSSPHGLALAHHRAAAAGVQLEMKSSRESAGPAMRGTRVMLRTALPPSATAQTPVQPPPVQPPQSTDPAQQAPR